MNISLRISEQARRFPDKKSVVFSQRNSDGSYVYPYYTFRQFEERSCQMAHFFTKAGIRPGMRTLLFVRPCLDFSVITFALFRMGAVPVLIDPGMGMKNLLASIRQVRPEAMISVGMVHWVRRLKRTAFESVKIKVSLEPVGGRTQYLYEGLSAFPKEFAAHEVSAEDLSAVLFTSGGTGIPKGVLYTHGILNAQTDALKAMFKLDETQTDLPGFPLFALFTLAMGMTSVIPDLDPTRPAQCDPKRLVQNILDSQATFVAGSPAIWERVGKFCLARNIQLGPVKQVVMFGAPVRAEIHQMFKKILPFGDTYTPYGATECLPVSLISGTEVLKDKLDLMMTGQGTCIGLPVAGTEVKILEATDIPECELHEVTPGMVGELAVTGPQVTAGYFEMPEETRKAKIVSNGRLWHRMGDMGRMDPEGHLWFLGRKAHRVEVDQETTFYPMQIEAIYNQHPEIKRTALVGLSGAQGAAPGLVIERHDGETRFDRVFLEELLALRRKTPAAQRVSRFFLHRAFPVDVRHNIKIDRTKLAAWAQKEGGVPCQEEQSTM